MNDLEFLQSWYISQCDGDWEHQFGISIKTLDNPGWSIIIDLEETEAEKILINEKSFVSDNDWFHIIVEDKKLTAIGSADKLIYLLKRIRQILT